MGDMGLWIVLFPAGAWPPLLLPPAQGWMQQGQSLHQWDGSCYGKSQLPQAGPGWRRGAACRSTGTEEQPILSLSQMEEGFMAGSCPCTELLQCAGWAEAQQHQLCQLSLSISFIWAAFQVCSSFTTCERKRKTRRPSSECAPSCCLLLCAHTCGVVEKILSRSRTFLLGIRMQSINPKAGTVFGR